MDRVAALTCQARLDAGLSVRDLAALAGLAPSTVTRIAQGSMNPTLDTLARLLAAAGCDLELHIRHRTLGSIPSIRAGGGTPTCFTGNQPS